MKQIGGFKIALTGKVAQAEEEPDFTRADKPLAKAQTTPRMA